MRLTLILCFWFLCLLQHLSLFLVFVGCFIVYTKDKSKQIVLRVSESQYDFLKNIAAVRGCNVSEIVRGFIDYFLVLWSDNK